MLKVNKLIWDEWNENHIAGHRITRKEVENAYLGRFKEIKSYRKRFLIISKIKNGKKLAIVISPEDKNRIKYKKGIYYVITAYLKEKL